jgi:hypothetical protein
VSMGLMCVGPRMKTISIMTVLCLTACCECAFMFPEDKLLKTYWQSLTAKAKHIFLMGYRTGTGPASEKAQRMPEVPPGFLVLSAKHFDEIIKLVDSFYEDAENQYVRVGGAIEIALMKMQKKSPDEIAKKIEKERQAVVAGF